MLILQALNAVRIKKKKYKSESSSEPMKSVASNVTTCKDVETRLKNEVSKGVEVGEILMKSNRPAGATSSFRALALIGRYMFQRGQPISSVSSSPVFYSSVENDEGAFSSDAEKKEAFDIDLNWCISSTEQQEYVFLSNSKQLLYIYSVLISYSRSSYFLLKMQR